MYKNYKIKFLFDFFSIISGEFNLTNMFDVLRDKESDICRGIDHKHPTASSMVSI